MGRPSRLRPRAQRAASQHGPAPLSLFSLSVSGSHPVVLVTAAPRRKNGAARRTLAPLATCSRAPTRARGRPQTLALLLLSSQPPPLPSPPSPRRFSEHQQQRAAVSCRAWRRRPSRHRSRAVAGMEPPSIHLRPRQISGPEMH